MTRDIQATLAAVGDIMLSGGYWEAARAGNAESLFTNLTPLLTKSDIAVGNLEGPLTERPPVWPPWRFCLRGHPEYARLLRSAGFGAISLANNHIMDYGWEGVEETISSLSGAGVRTFGAGVNLTSARAPLRIVLGGVGLSFLGYSDVPVNAPFYATATRAGAAPAGVEMMIEDIRRARRAGDIVVVCIHWGQEMVSCPSPRQRRTARKLISAGASLILGHHPHVLQGIEKIQTGLVAYSLGTYSVCEEEWIGRDRKGNSFRMMHMGPNDGWRRQGVLTVSLASDGTVCSHHLDPTYIGADMHLDRDTRPERAAQLGRNDALLRSPLYACRWQTEMLQSRVRDYVEHLQGQTSLWKRMFQLRPRHLKMIGRTLSNEWQQLRGVR